MSQTKKITISVMGEEGQGKTVFMEMIKASLQEIKPDFVEIISVTDDPESCVNADEIEIVWKVVQ